jgi:hypothetical protein
MLYAMGECKMPFNEETASAAGSRGGGKRWKNKDPETVRNKQLKVVVTPTEYSNITSKAAAAGLSNAELVVRAVEAYNRTLS